MAFQEKVLPLGTADTLLFECPATMSGSAHGVVFSNLTGVAQAFTLKHFSQASGATTTICSRQIAAYDAYPWPKPINMVAGDRIIASAANAAAVVAVLSIYLDAAAPAAVGFVPRGQWVIGATYQPNDVVADGGSAWVAVDQHSGSQPPSSHWVEMVKMPSLQWADILGKPAFGTAAGLAADADATLAAASDARLATQKAVKGYIDGLLGAQDAMVFKGVLAGAGNPNYPAADCGWTYRVSSAGRVGGAAGPKVEAGDIVICLVDGTPAGTQAAVGGSWNIIQANLDGALTTDSIGVSVQAYSADLLPVAVATHGAQAKATVVDADEIPIADSAAGFGLKRLPLANLIGYVFGAARTFLGSITAQGAANKLTMAGGGAGSAVTLTATGSDANIGVDIVTKGAGALTVNGAPVGGGGSAYMYLREEQPTGNGSADRGTSIGLAGLARTLNTVVRSSITGASLANSIVTLPAGTYSFRARAGLAASNTPGGVTHRISLYDTTSGAYKAIGSATGMARSDDGFSANEANLTEERVVFASAVTLQLMHFSTANNATAPRGVSDGRTEVFTILEIWKTA